MMYLSSNSVKYWSRLNVILAQDLINWWNKYQISLFIIVFVVTQEDPEEQRLQEEVEELMEVLSICDFFGVYV